MSDPLDRRQFLGLSAAGLLTQSALRMSRGDDKSQPDLAWHNVQEWGIEGKGWDDTEKYFDRLPGRAKGVVRDAVWSLSRHSAGMLVRFRTDATSLWCDYTVTSPKLEMAHMPATGVSGLDLYAETEEGQSRWVSIVKPTGRQTTAQIISDLIPGERNYSIYLPLYNGTESLKIGVPRGASFTGLEPRKERPLVFYGTSITHGACASRTGMPHPAILGRRLDRPVINLGFSGNGRMETEVGRFLVELDPAVYIVDCLPNITGPEVAERTIPLLQQLRGARPDTPIVVVEDRTYPNAAFLRSRQQRHADSRAALQAAYQQLQQGGMEKLFYIKGEDLLGDDRDDTTDGSHPSDLGFYRQANAFEPVLKAALAVS